MKKLNMIFALMYILSLFIPSHTFAATTPSLGVSSTFGILSSTYTNTSSGTINGDLGYTTPPSVNPTVNGTTYIADATYNQAGIDQASAMTIANTQVCDFNFNSATDLSLLPQPLTAGVYCITAATSIGTSGMILLDSDTYIFKITGALTTVANSNVVLSGGTSACNIFWLPTAAATLAANTTFMGTIISPAGITIGSTTNWTGRALAYGGTVTTDSDTITVPSCIIPPVIPPTPVITGGGVVLPMFLTQNVVSPTIPIPTPVVTAPTTTTTQIIQQPITTYAQIQNTTVPGLPNTGLPPKINNNIAIFFSVTVIMFVLYAARKKQII